MRQNHKSTIPNDPNAKPGFFTMSPNQEIHGKILTLPNLITFIRMLLIPLFTVLALNGYRLEAALLFGFTAATDFADGQVARRTNSVSKLGIILDPAVDVLLMISSIVVLFLLDAIPVWIMVLILAREALVFTAAAYLILRKNIRIPVIFAGKIATTLLFFGVFLLLGNFIVVPSLGVVQTPLLPGFNACPVSFGIWFIYAGTLLSIGVAVVYAKKAICKLKNTNDGNVDCP